MQDEEKSNNYAQQEFYKVYYKPLTIMDNITVSSLKSI